MEDTTGQRRQEPGTEKPRRQRLRLPFEARQRDAGEWSYDHRAGISLTLIVYLLVGIGFLWGKIELGRTDGEGTILIEFPEDEKPVPLTPEQIKALEAMMPDDFRDVRNQASNENAELNAALRDAKGTNASELYEAAGSLDDKMRANREAYEEGLRQVEAMKNSAMGNETDAAAQDTKVQGRVTVSFSFTDPVRTSVRLVVPAYMCEGGGTIVVNAVLDTNGRVISAQVDKSLSSPDHCMQSSAENAALASRFNMDTSAPAKQRGTITYIFIPQ